MASAQLVCNIAVLGAGRMGSALVRALCVAGHDVSVWNRDHAKAAALAGAGAVPVTSISEALTAQIILVCVADYRSSRELFEPLADELAGKLVVQLTTGSPAEAEAFGDFLESAGAESLDGAIIAYPKDVGRSSSRILLSGDRRLHERVKPVMSLFGRPVFVDERRGAANAMDGVLLFHAYARTFAYFQGAALLMAQGYEWRDLSGEIGSRPNDTETLGSWEAAIESRSHAGTEATLDVHFAAFSGVAAIARERGLYLPLIGSIHEHFERARASGHGRDELSAVFETFRPKGL